MKALKIILTIVILFSIHKTIAQTKVYVTEKGTRYHTKECRLLPKKRIETVIKKAKVKGYSQCKVCVPKEVSQKKTSTVKKSTTKKTAKKKYRNSKKSIASRCTATTQKGSRCKRRTKNASGRCWQHD
jgi:hypothetical protein